MEIMNSNHCQICQKSFQINSQLIQHIIKCQKANKLKISSILNEFNFSETVYSSDSDCDYEIITTFRRIPRKNLECKIEKNEPNLILVEEPYLIEYVDEEEEEEELEEEDDEEEDEEEEIIIKEEIIVKSPDQPQTCSVCQKVFTNIKNLKSHIMKSHDAGLNNESNQFICSICGKGFKLSRYLKSHEKIHSGIKAYKCETCLVSFIHMHSLKSHRRIHTGEKPYKCKIEGCEKLFSFYSGLKQHILVVHTADSKKFICDFCEKGFPTKGRYNEHVRTHTGEKPLICEVCNKGFNSYGILNVHRRTHTGIRPFKCKICGKSFIKNHGLTQHNKTKKRCFPPKSDKMELNEEYEDKMDKEELEDDEEVLSVTD